MWRSILGVVLIPSLLWAQDATPMSNTPQGDQQKLRQDYQVLTEWQAIKRGASEKAVIRFFLVPIFIVSPYEPSRDLVPLKLEFEESDGIAATSFRFDSDHWEQFKFREEPARKELMLQPPGDSDYGIPGNPRVVGNVSPKTAVANSQLDIWEKSRVRVLPPTFEVAIKLKASKRAKPGAHLLRGKITYQPISANGALPPQEMDLALPVTVVDKGAIAQRNPEYMEKYGSDSGFAGLRSGSKGETLALILLSPILVPLMILGQVVCGINGQDCRC